jgi:hypothetical protein
MRDLTRIVLEVPKYSLIAVITISYGKRIQQARFSIHGFTSICNVCISYVFAIKIVAGPQNCIMYINQLTVLNCRLSKLTIRNQDYNVIQV